MFFLILTLIADIAEVKKNNVVSEKIWCFSLILVKKKTIAHPCNVTNLDFLHELLSDVYIYIIQSGAAMNQITLAQHAKTDMYV